MPSVAKRIGVISDTHGLLRPEAVAALSDVDRLIHCGDVGSPEVLEELRAIAPLVVVRGNNDRGAWANELPATDVLDVSGVTLYVLHDLGELDLDPAAAGFHAVVTGHSHRPRIETRKGVLYVNPGSAGPRRFSLPIAVARLDIVDGGVSGRIVELRPEVPSVGRASGDRLS